MSFILYPTSYFFATIQSLKNNGCFDCPEVGIASEIILFFEKK